MERSHCTSYISRNQFQIADHIHGSMEDPPVMVGNDENIDLRVFVKGDDIEDLGKALVLKNE